GSFGFGARLVRARGFVVFATAGSRREAVSATGSVSVVASAAAAAAFAFAADRFRPPREPRRVGFFAGASVLASDSEGLSAALGERRRGFG
ncbi:MAG TPA: hypothetical protein VIW01_07435, partial [Dehalococcoidia bacterium]